MRPTVTYIFHDPETGYFGYKTRFIGAESFHHVLDTSLTYEDALAVCDPHSEYVWEKPDGSDPNILLVSRAFKEGSPRWIMQQWRSGNWGCC